MPAHIRTFGHDFRNAGYKTAIAGKWQLGKFDEFPAQPVEHGFDDYCMWAWIYKGRKTSRYYGPVIHRDGKTTAGSAEEFGPDAYSDFLLDFIDRNKSDPFCIYFPMALVHSPFIHPPQLEELARTKFTDDLDKKTVAFGHMITYMDDIVGKLLAKLKEHGLEKNTLVLFTGDNGTHKSITSKLPSMSLKGGKGSMTEAGSRVPLLAWWPGTIRPAVRNEFFCLVDVLPTIASVAGIKLQREVDGLDLSHLLSGTAGSNREHILMSYGRGFYVRDPRFRLHEDGTLYDIPISSDRERYGERKADPGEFGADRKRLQRILDEFMAIETEFEKPGASKKGPKKNRKK